MLEDICTKCCFVNCSIQKLAVGERFERENRRLSCFETCWTCTSALAANFLDFISASKCEIKMTQITLGGGGSCRFCGRSHVPTGDRRLRNGGLGTVYDFNNIESSILIARGVLVIFVEFSKFEIFVEKFLSVHFIIGSAHRSLS